MAGNRGPTPTQRDQQHQTLAEVEVVTADGARKPASLPQRVKDKVRDTLSMTDDLPTWQPGELADDIVAAGNAAVEAALEEAKPKGPLVGGVVWPPSGPDQPPQAVMVVYRQQHTENVQRVADQTMRHASQMVAVDKHARDRVYDIGHRTALLALCNEAAAQLAADGWANVSPALIGEFAAEIDGWKQDRGIS